MAFGGAATEEGAKGAPCPPDAVRMHRFLLYLQPRYAEQEYFRHLEAFDLVNCLIAPIFFANALSLWTRGVLSSIYCAVLLLKGYQIGLLLLPNAHRVQAHKRTRYWLILGERVLRQCVATPLLGRGPRFQAWLAQQAAHANKTLFCMRLLLLMSGLTISFWNAFCLQLDFVSNVLVTLVFFCIHFQANCPQIAYVFQLLVERVPHLLLLQQGLEYTFTTAAQLFRTAVLLQPAVTTIAYGSAAAAVYGSCSSGEARGTLSALDASAGTGTCQIVFNAPPLAAGGTLYDRPQPAPDFDSIAGRFIITCSATYMVFAVLFVPLYMSWRIERSWKSRWMASLPEAQLQQRLLQQCGSRHEQNSGALKHSTAAGGSSSSKIAAHLGDASKRSRSSTQLDRPDGGVSRQRQQQGQQQHLLWRNLLMWQWWCSGLASSGSDSSSFVYPPVVFDMAPPARILMQHLGLLLVVALGVGGAVTALCTFHRPLSAVFFTWKQLI